MKLEQCQAIYMNDHQKSFYKMINLNIVSTTISCWIRIYGMSSILKDVTFRKTKESIISNSKTIEFRDLIKYVTM